MLQATPPRSPWLCCTLLIVATAVVPAAAAPVSQLGAPAHVADSATLSSFTVPAGIDRLLVVTVSDDDGGTISNVTFGATPVTSAAFLSLLNFAGGTTMRIPSSTASGSCRWAAARARPRPPYRPPATPLRPR